MEQNGDWEAFKDSDTIPKGSANGELTQAVIPSRRAEDSKKEERVVDGLRLKDQNNNKNVAKDINSRSGLGFGQLLPPGEA